MGMKVDLTPQLEEMVRAKVASGLYGSASDVVREALRLMTERDRARETRLGELKAEIRRGLECGDAEYWDAEAILREARARRGGRSG